MNVRHGAVSMTRYMVTTRRHQYDVIRNPNVPSETGKFFNKSRTICFHSTSIDFSSGHKG